MKSMLCALALSLSTAIPVFGQSVEGDWQGTLTVGPAELRIVVHVARDSSGTLKGTLDSPDQGASGIPISSMSASGAILRFEISPIAAAFEGTVNSGATAINGTWRQMGMSVPLDLTRAPSGPSKARVAKPSDIDGDWAGTLDTGVGSLRLVLHITTYEDGMTAKMDSPDQNAFGLPATSINRDGVNVRFEMKQIAGNFVGTLDKDMTSIAGDWTQIGNTLPLVLRRVKKTP
jgi:hypothetical protein